MGRRPQPRGRPRDHVASGRLSQVRHAFASVPREVIGRRLRRSESQGLDTNPARCEDVRWELPHISTTNGTPSWDRERQTYRGFFGRIGRMNQHPSSYQYFFRPGLTWSRRSQRGFSLRALPKGCIFADKGPCVFASDSSLPMLLGLANSRVFHALVVLQMAFGSYEVGVLQRTPVPDLNNTLGDQLGRRAVACVELKRDHESAAETSHVFHLPALLQAPGGTLAARIACWQSRVAEAERQLVEHQREIDDIAFRLYGIEGEDRRAIEEAVALSATADEDTEDDP
jgi:hypothetical protein